MQFSNKDYEISSTLIGCCQFLKSSIVDVFDWFAFATRRHYNKADSCFQAENAPEVCQTAHKSLRSAVRTTTATVDGAVYRTDRHASVNLCLSQPAWTTTTKRRRQNLIVRSGKSEAELALDVLYYWSYRHETSRGLSATAGLLVGLSFAFQYRQSGVTFGPPRTVLLCRPVHNVYTNTCNLVWTTFIEI